ncbi:hypothetical protein Efla_005890 [Eimeria flavescens]
MPLAPESLLDFLSGPPLTFSRFPLCAANMFKYRLMFALPVAIRRVCALGLKGGGWPCGPLSPSPFVLPLPPSSTRTAGVLLQLLLADSGAGFHQRQQSRGFAAAAAGSREASAAQALRSVAPAGVSVHPAAPPQLLSDRKRKILNGTEYIRRKTGYRGRIRRGRQAPC